MMKKKKIKLYYSLLTALILFCCVNTIQSQSFNKKYSWSYPINHHGTLAIDNYNCDIEIVGTNSDKIDFELKVTAEGGSEDDIIILDSYLNELEFNASSGKVELSTIFYEKQSSNLKTKITLNNNKIVGFKNIKRKAYLKIPKYITLELSTKYSDIIIPDLEKFELKSYKDNIEAANIKIPSRIDAKYSKIVLKDISDCKFYLYNCNIDIGSSGNMNVNSKYSKLHVGNCGNLTIKCYNDKYEFKETGNVEFNGKYTDFISLSSGDLNINAYKCNFKSGDILAFQVKESKYSVFKFAKTTNVAIDDSYNNKFAIDNTGKTEVDKTKYSSFKFASATDLDVNDSYKDNFTIDHIEKIKTGTSKYSEYIHNHLEKSFSLMNGYKNKININETNKNFKYLDLNGKYEDIKIGILSDLPLKLDIDTKYGSIDFNDSSYKNKILIKENSTYKLNAIRFSEIENMPYVKVRGYKISLMINDIN